MVRIFSCCFFLFSCAVLSAQMPPWNAKFIVYHPDGYTDTLWVGCDENATDGYDEGLDSLDNSFEYPISIGAFSPEVDAEFGLDNCVNLKRDIRPFGYPTEFTFFIVHDELETIENAMIAWDTLDFNYLSDDSLFLRECVIQAQSGYILGIDNTIHYVALYNELIDTSYYIFPQDSITLIPELSHLECSPSDYAIKLKLIVYFEKITTNVIESNIVPELEFYPNPVRDELIIRSNKNEQLTILISNMLGERMLINTIENNPVQLLFVNNLPSGSYQLAVLDVNGRIILTKIIYKM